MRIRPGETVSVRLRTISAPAKNSTEMLRIVGVIIVVVIGIVGVTVAQKTRV